MPSRGIDFDTLLRRLRSLGDPRAVEGMSRFGIHSTAAYGVPAPVLRKIASEIGRDHNLARKLWTSGILEARVLACLIGDPEKVTEELMERWVRDFDNWAVCDAACGNLFDKTPHAWKKVNQWSRRKEEFIKRAAFSLLAQLAVHDKVSKDSVFMEFLPIIKRESTDERNFVKKAVNWALRQIGKRNLTLNKSAIHTAKEIRKLNSTSARWIAADALRELTGDAVRRRLSRKNRIKSQ